MNIDKLLGSKNPDDLRILVEICKTLPEEDLAQFVAQNSKRFPTHDELSTYLKGCMPGISAWEAFQMNSGNYFCMGNADIWISGEDPRRSPRDFIVYKKDRKTKKDYGR